ncbi:RNA polymerase sigma factor [Geodermatophilus marinus]|uniref:RNA polymerase sigma factor n=1 Tax=Geodermatophilus sp. LHW52908 TaxID=2303986 RepID=UPI000E3BDE6F|nr:sigma-70 family RNA polymerase sigma factor [Geodermatophilus sp. LHW52908]RFU21662.1 sigma-70 family RNA polymerase sigma factor [Geodermatophilus sp. LHW52908]
MDPAADDHGVPELVAGALDGDPAAWDRLVERFTPLVLAVVRRHRLQDAEAQDVAQTVWLRLVEHLGSIREPGALPGWIATTTRNECLHVLRGHRLASPADLDARGGPADGAPAPDHDLLAGERHEALLGALAELPERQRALLLLLIEDPPLPYEEIGRRLGMPVGSIGPTRARALTRIRAHHAVQALLEA